MRPRFARASACLWASVLLVSAALADDEPVFIEADYAEIDDRRGVSVYRGDVVVTQGAMRLTADELTVYGRGRGDDGGEVDRMVATGNPATFRQERDGDARPVRAEAPRMEYEAGDEIIVLLEGGRLWQGPNELTGERITYRRLEDVVTADRDDAGDRRVHIRVLPADEDDDQ